MATLSITVTCNEHNEFKNNAKSLTI